MGRSARKASVVACCTLLCCLCADVLQADWAEASAALSPSEARSYQIAEAAPTQREPSRFVHYAQLRRVCPKGARLHLSFDGTTLSIDAWWLNSVIVYDIDAFADRCPSGAVRTRDLRIYAPDQADLIGVFAERNLPLSEIRIEDTKNRYLGLSPTEIPTAPQTRLVTLSGGSIDDISFFLGRTGLGRSGKRYRLQHGRSTGAPESLPFVVSCLGPEGDIRGRACTAQRYRYGPDLLVQYQFSASGAEWKWASKRLEPLEEPVGLIELDARVRNWIDELRR